MRYILGKTIVTSGAIKNYILYAISVVHEEKSDLTYDLFKFFGKTEIGTKKIISNFMTYSVI